MDLFDTREGSVHIRIQQRNGKKCLTLISGIGDDLYLYKITKYLKKFFNTNGCVMTDPQHGEIIQLQGDQRMNVREALIDWKIAEKEHIRVHGG